MTTQACAREEETGLVCANCGKPATVTEYWSTSPQRPHTRVLKRQVCCSGRQQRSHRWAGNRQPGCPVITEVLREESLTAPLIISPPPPCKGEITMAMKSDFTPTDEAPSNGIPVRNDESNSASGRGRLSGEERARIVKLHQAGASAESIAQQLSRSIKVVQKVLDDSGEDLPATNSSQEFEPEGHSKVDHLLELLSEIPEQAVEHLLGLVQLRRQEKELRKRLLEAMSQEPG